MVLNKEIFYRDPTVYSIPNNGVTKIGEPQSDQEWEVARYELEQFVCDGSYREGLRTILESYLADLSQPTQRAVWVHGFYGCGKSHLVRVLDFLWRDLRFPDGASARNLAQLPPEITAALIELSTAGRQRGGLWSAAGTIGAGSQNPREAILSLVLRAAGLAERIDLAQFDLWVRQQGYYHDLVEALKKRGKNYHQELNYLYISTPLSQELLNIDPDLAKSPTELQNRLAIQFQDQHEVTTELMVDMMRQVFELKSSTPGKLPCVLIVIDELQQYLGDSNKKADMLQDAVQAAVSRFQSSLLFVATGQSALQATATLQKLQDRFTVHIPLEDKDTESVLRQTVLRKKTSSIPLLEQALNSARGEIDRHLGGTKIEPVHTDEDYLAADYPLLPTRLRFWQIVLRALDKSGKTGQLRTQLRLAYEAARSVAAEPVGFVPGADLIFDQQRHSLIQGPLLLRDVDEAISRQDDGTPEGKLKARILALLFLIEQVDDSVGIKATASVLADLLVTNLPSGSAALRQQVPLLLQELEDQGLIMLLDDEYRIQTKEGADWDRAFRTQLAAIQDNELLLAQNRQQLFQGAVEKNLPAGLTINQGKSREPRKLELHFGPEPPPIENRVSIWVASEWDFTLASFLKEAQAAGADSPVVFVFLKRTKATELKTNLASYLAARAVLTTRQPPTTDEGRQARTSLEARQDRFMHESQRIAETIVINARVFQGGGTEIQADSIDDALKQACHAALMRLYPRFPEADYKSWHRVFHQAQHMNQGALEAIGHRGSVANHPVAREILNHIGAQTKTGTEIRKYFQNPPYGWPRDAINGTLAILVLDGQLRASYNNAPISAQSLTVTKIQQTEFKVEQRVLTTQERLAIRTLLKDTDINYKIGAENLAVPRLLGTMKKLAAASSGPAPLPQPPDIHYITRLEALVGNEQLAGIYDQREQILGDYRAWSAAREKIRVRLPQWELLLKLLPYASDLPVFGQVQPEIEAIEKQRKLLAEPDPVPPLLSKITTALREAILAARNKHLKAYQNQLTQLNEDHNWRRLTSARQQAIRKQRGLAPLKEINLETDEHLRQALQDTSLSGWEDKTNAMRERVSQAIHDAARELVPTAERLFLPRTTINTEDELNNYLQQIKKEALAVIKTGKPVVLS